MDTYDTSVLEDDSDMQDALERLSSFKSIRSLTCSRQIGLVAKWSKGETDTVSVAIFMQSACKKSFSFSAAFVFLWNYLDIRPILLFLALFGSFSVVSPLLFVFSLVSSRVQLYGFA